MPKVNITPENMKLVREYAKVCNMTEEECVNHHLPRGIKRSMALTKHRGSIIPKTVKKTAKKTAKKPAKKTAKKTSAKTGKEASAKTGKEANGKATNGKATDVMLLKLKKGGMSNPQIAKQMGLSKDQVYRGLKRAQA